jgi:hypothetical protein
MFTPNDHFPDIAKVADQPSFAEINQKIARSSQKSIVWINSNASDRRSCERLARNLTKICWEEN